jgi:hypothetical protein
MLWDIISDEEVFRFLPKATQSFIHQVFVNNLQGFYETECKIPNNTIIDLNKKYIILILNYIKKNYPVIPNKITIHDELPNQKITLEEIKQEKQQLFEQELGRKQQEFNDFIQVKVPPVPDFSDKQIDTPIKEMDKILKEMQMKRNYEIEQINLHHDKVNNNNNQAKVNTNVSANEKKTVSFNKDMDQIIEPEEDIMSVEENVSLFAKLKKINPPKTNEDRIEDLEREIRFIKNSISQIIELLQKS